MLSTSPLHHLLYLLTHSSITFVTFSTSQHFPILQVSIILILQVVEAKEGHVIHIVLSISETTITSLTQAFKDLILKRLHVLNLIILTFMSVLRIDMMTEIINVVRHNYC